MRFNVGSGLNFGGLVFVGYMGLVVVGFLGVWFIVSREVQCRFLEMEGGICCY